MIFSSPRTFQLWDYHVSHSRLLLRSPASPGDAKNQDILFYGVESLDIPTIFRGLEIDSDAAAGEGDTPTCTTFRLTSEGRFHRLSAVACQVMENELELFDTCLATPFDDRPRELLGRVLARS